MHGKALKLAGAGVVVLAAVVLYWALGADTYRAADILAVYRDGAAYGDITVAYPLDETVFPPEMVPPVFRWEDSSHGARAWLVRFAFADGGPEMHFPTRRPRWTALPREWERIKERSLEREARVLILGVGRGRPVRILSQGRMSFRTSQDPVGAPLFYREVILPFEQADKDPSRIRWRFGPISSPKPPPVVLKNLSVCANCHSFPRDGSILAMDADYANSKGSYVITAVQPEMTLVPEDIISWSEYGGYRQAYGLLSQISPDGRHVVSTVEDMAVFIARPSLAFSQLFFPVKGILCIYDRQADTFTALPGADDPNFVQSNATWSPDGKYLVFARMAQPDLSETRGQGLSPLTRPDCEWLIKDSKPFRFDLYRIPFNDGAGGTAEPLAGASHNGLSNYFPRYSPDGRWIVFCRARSYMLLQPDSELYMIPAEGGEARRLRCNTRRMNSWHSWSPNGKWLVFASKAHSDYTQLCLTHIDANGDSTPAVFLPYLTAPDRAANIPEFVNTHPQAIVRIREQFVKERGR